MQHKGPLLGCDIFKSELAEKGYGMFVSVRRLGMLGWSV